MHCRCKRRWQCARPGNVKKTVTKMLFFISFSKQEHTPRLTLTHFRNANTYNVQRDIALQGIVPGQRFPVGYANGTQHIKCK